MKWLRNRKQTKAFQILWLPRQVASTYICWWANQLQLSKDKAFEAAEKLWKLDKAIIPTKHRSNWEMLNSLITLNCFIDYVFICCILYFVSNASSVKVLNHRFILPRSCIFWYLYAADAMTVLLMTWAMGIAQLLDDRVQSLRGSFSRETLTIKTIASDVRAQSESLVTIRIKQNPV